MSYNCLFLFDSHCLTAPELQCDFEKGLCNWEQEQSGEDVFDWALISGPTPTLNTGPLRDHTLGTSNGHYLYIESSLPQEFKDTAVLLSQVFQPTYQPDKDPSSPQKKCVFRFHYHMFGLQVFSLAVHLRTTATGLGEMIWEKCGHQGNLWYRETLYLQSAKPFQVIEQNHKYSLAFRLQYEGFFSFDVVLS